MTNRSPSQYRPDVLPKPLRATPVPSHLLSATRFIRPTATNIIHSLGSPEMPIESKLKQESVKAEHELAENQNDSPYSTETARHSLCSHVTPCQTSGIKNRLEFDQPIPGGEKKKKSRVDPHRAFVGRSLPPHLDGTIPFFESCFRRYPIIRSKAAMMASRFPIQPTNQSRNAIVVEKEHQPISHKIPFARFSFGALFVVTVY
ncbi:hypothetical protein V8C34DRAFT_59952 [Trichoderma compactum]